MELQMRDSSWQPVGATLQGIRGWKWTPAIVSNFKSTSGDGGVKVMRIKNRKIK